MKRDRWESSSEDENESAEASAARTTTTATNVSIIATKKRTVSEPSTKVSTNSPSLPLYNPLLRGCRLVYDSFERLKRLEEGTYGVVWKARDLATQEIVALKQIKFDKDMIKEGFPVTALREINVLLSLSHESIVSVKEMVVGSAFDKVFMVLEFMEMDLKEAMKRTGDGPFTQSELKGMLHQILSGMQHIHYKWLLHRDMKTSNILVHESGRVAICDFGLARKFQHPLKPLTQMVITLWYRPPELLFGETVYGPAVDMWSIGCIMGELITKDAILQGQGELDQADKIFRLVGAVTPENWPDFENVPSSGIFRWKSHKVGGDLATQFPINSSLGGNTFLDGNGFDLLSKLLTLDPTKRIDANDALNHPYFKEGVAKQIPKFYFDKSS
jgi:cell division cycle 2-like